MTDKISHRIEDHLARDGIYVSMTHGVSMRPMLREGRDTVLISPTEGRLSRYDVALYRRGEDYILHRVVEVRERDYVICGDNCIAKEYGIPDNRIVGVLTGFMRDGKYVNMKGCGYRLYSRIWVALYPVRRVFLCVRLWAGRVYHRLFVKR